MSLRRTLPTPERDRVLVLDDALDAKVIRELTHRTMIAEQVWSAPTLDQLRRARGAIVSVSQGGAGAEFLRRHGSLMLDHGLLLCVATADDAGQLVASESLSGLPPEEIERKVAPEPHVFAELLARHNPFAAADPAFSPEYMENVEELSAEDRLLMSRAFEGAGTVRLEEMTSGLSKARVFSVHTTMGNSFGSWTQPLFAKLDRRDKVAKEALGYTAAAPFIPFGLCPKIEKVLHGARRGVLVGSFADHSEALWDVARRGMAGQAIFNLFDTTLGGWRAQGLRGSPIQGSVWASLKMAKVIVPDRIRAEYYEEACALGEGLRPAEIAARLEGLVQACRRGPIHGDLHADNVRVRGTDAILIDMASTTYGPLSADVATLETWLAIALPQKERSEAYRDTEWEAVVQSLYAPETFADLPLPSEGGAKFRWMWDVVRQVRAIGLSHQSCATEYQTAVVATLLRRCMFPPTCRADKFRRVTAYRLASRLTEALSANSGEVRHVA